MRSAVYLVIYAAVCMLPVNGEDFYQLLGLSRQAGAREIRKAFKKLALTMHPDKNPDDPEAHDKFLKINRAYEVLKDEDLRKKYDLYGEEGLNEDGPSGRGYQSWNFYQHDFGIYDDDPEIITLSKSDFEQSVQNSGDIWFVNFYSPRCSHCHELAPTWREVARQLEGVIRIGAVNCGDEWVLCRNQGIRSYPSLVLFPQKEKFYGERSIEELVQYSLRQVPAQVVELWDGNFASEMNDDVKSRRPWLITFCGDGGDCLELSTSRKLAAMLADLVTVGGIDCHASEDLCIKLGIDHGTHFFPAKKVEKGKGLEISSLVAREISFVVLEQLPDLQELDGSLLDAKLDRLKRSENQEALLVHFVEGTFIDLELRKLEGLLTDIEVGRVDCSIQRTFCNNLHIHKFPTFTVFKVGGGHEFHHGRQTAHDIAAFARDSSHTPVRVLDPSDFPSVTESQQPWFIDFYAPWCPPCMKLLPEFRKASKSFPSQIRFGTVDCTVHTTLCQKYNVKSYPTTVLYNHTIPHHFHGQHNAHSIVEFIQMFKDNDRYFAFNNVLEFIMDTLNPPVTILNRETFTELLRPKNEDEIWLVDYFAPWCGPCQQLAPEWRQLAKMMKSNKRIKVGQVDCQAHRDLCQQEGVQSYPSIRLYPTGHTHTRVFHTYSGWYRDAQSLRAWAFGYLPSKVTVLDWHSFQQKVMQSGQPWVVDFYAPWCGHCQVFAPEFERVAESLSGRVSAGKVDCDRHRGLCQQAGIQAYPSVRFYKGNQRSMFGEDINSQNADQIIRLLKSKVPAQRNIKDEL